MAGNNEKSLKEAIGAMFDDLDLSQKISENRLITNWESIVGKLIAKHTTKIYIKKGVLFLYLDNPSLKNELVYSREKIIELLNETAGEQVIKEVVIR